MEKLIISPRTRIMQLIEAYPRLEEILIREVPAFSKLKNPILRKTVARITTLQQAAIVGQIEVEFLINLLRKEVGQEIVDTGTDTNLKSSIKTAQPNPADIFRSLDAKPMLDAGEHPVAQVMEDLKQMPYGKVYVLHAPFIPAPLIDKAASLGFQHSLEQTTSTSWTVYFKHQN
jgi:hypothetical protein